MQNKISNQIVSAGSLFIFKLPVEVPVQWCAIFQHPDNEELWFTVPADEFSLVGTKDVEVPEGTACGPLNLRCQSGVWIHANDFSTVKQVGEIEAIFVEQVQDRLSRIVSGDLPDASFLVGVESDPDYLEWIEELSEAVDDFQTYLEL